MTSSKYRVGISSCLLGESVRYDGRHKRSQAVLDLLDERFEAVPICPEVEAGMGVPREAVQLVAGNMLTRMVGVDSGKDWTVDMAELTTRKLDELSTLSGFIFKSRSPSCGVKDIPISDITGSTPVKPDAGLFAQAVMRNFPSLPVIDEDALQNSSTRNDFIARVIEQGKSLSEGSG